MKRNIKKYLAICFVMLLLVTSACSTSEVSVNKGPSFGVNIGTLLKELEKEGFVYEQFELIEYEDHKYDAKRYEGRILLDNGGTVDDVTDDEAVGLDIETYNDSEIYWIELPGWITKSGTSDKLIKIYGIILTTIEPGISPEFHKNMDKFSDSVFEKESDNIRMTTELLETADYGVRIRTRIVCKEALKEMLN